MSSRFKCISWAPALFFQLNYTRIRFELTFLFQNGTPRVPAMQFFPGIYPWVNTVINPHWKWIKLPADWVCREQRSVQTPLCSARVDHRRCPGLTAHQDEPALTCAPSGCLRLSTPQHQPPAPHTSAWLRSAHRQGPRCWGAGSTALTMGGLLCRLPCLKADEGVGDHRTAGLDKVGLCR